MATSEREPDDEAAPVLEPGEEFASLEEPDFDLDPDLMEPEEP